MKGKPVERDVDRMRARLDRANTDGDQGRDVLDASAHRLRRRRGVTGGVVIAALAALVIVTPHLLKTSPTTNAETDPTNGAAIAADPAKTDPCPKQPIDVSDPSGLPALTTVAVSVRLCPAMWPDPGSGTTRESSWTPPIDALVADAPAFVDAVESLPAWDPHACANTDYDGEPFAIVVSYAETSFVLGARAPLCQPIRISGRDVDAADVVDAYEELAGSLPWG